MSTASASNSGTSWVAWILMTVGGLITALLALAFVVLVFGSVTGIEFSPDSFSRRGYSHLRLPLLDWQITSVVFVPLPGGTEGQLVTAGVIPAAAMGQNRWHYVGTMWEEANGWRYPPGILLNYLDAGPGGTSVWGQWSTKNPALAKVFWPVVVDLARHAEYQLLPELFDIAASASDATALKRDLDRATARLLREEGARRQGVGQTSEALDAYNRSLALVPKSPATLLLRAAAHQSAGDSAKAAADKAAAEMLKREAIDPDSVGGAVGLETPQRDSSMIYLDHNSTTPLDPRVATKLAEALAAGYLNPASQHQAGARARRAIEAAREQCVRLVGGRVEGMQADRLLFTSGGTEANNLALLGLAGEPPGRVLISAIEHPSVVGPAEELARRGFEVERIAVDSAGVVRLDHLDALLARPARLASVMLVNNETGVVQPVAEIARRCRACGVLCHTDAAQAAGKIAVDFAAFGVDALTLAPHKFHGPLGIGGLLLAHGVTPRPVLWGGFQQESLRPGTEPVALAIAAAESLRLAIEELPARAAQMAMLRDRLEARLMAELSELVIHGRAAPRVPSTSLLSFVGVDRQALLMALDLAGVACSTGSACQSGSSEPSPVLLAMGCPEPWTASALRFSLGAFTTAEEIEAAARIIAEQVRRLRG